MSDKVKTIKVYKNAKMFREEQNASFKIKKYIEIEFFNGDIIRLIGENGADITKYYDDIIITDKGKLKKIIFKNSLA